MSYEFILNGTRPEEGGYENPQALGISVLQKMLQH